MTEVFLCGFIFTLILAAFVGGIYVNIYEKVLDRKRKKKKKRSAAFAAIIRLSHGCECITAIKCHERRNKKMTDLNKVVLIGRLVQTPELRTVGNNGFKVLDFTIAVNKSFKKKGADEWTDKVSYIDCVATGPLAERRSQASWMTKGNPVSVVGSLSQDRWEKDGQKFSKITVSCDEVSPVPSQKKDGEKPAEPQGEQAEKPVPTDAELAEEYEQSAIF